MMNEVTLRTMTVGEIVAADNRTATVFKEAGIDFCCGGRKTLEESCREKGIDPEDLAGKLENVDAIPGAVKLNFNEWDPVFLSDYIVNVHHKFVTNNLPELVHYTGKIASVHGMNHPELIVIADLIVQVNDELQKHMKKEEEILFPALREMFSGGSPKVREAVERELPLLFGEHEFAGGALDRINEITDGYRLPEDACNSYRLAFSLLEKFEDDLHIHVHLENNILFPKIQDALN
jgi:regulator of cell morphogenesis and NO signaling